MKLFSFIFWNFILYIFMKTLKFNRAHFMTSEYLPHNSKIITNVQSKKHLILEKKTHSRISRYTFGYSFHKVSRSKRKNYHYLKLYLTRNKYKLRKKLNPILVSEKKNLSIEHNLKVGCQKNILNDSNKLENEEKGNGCDNEIRTDGSGQYDKNSRDVNDDIKGESTQNATNINPKVDIKDEMCCKNNELLSVSELLKNIKENEISKDENNASNETENSNLNLMEHFTTGDDNSLISNLKPEESKELINSDHFKKIMKDINLKEEEIMDLLNRSEKNVSNLINKNLTLEQIEKNAKNEEIQNEKLFDVYMNSNSSKIGNFINFKKIGKKYKDVIAHVITIFLNKKKKFSEMINLIEDKNEINQYVSLLKEDILFNDLNNDVITEIVKKSVLMGYLNEKFSNDAENFEWNRQVENCIVQAVRNSHFNIKIITYSDNSINVTVDSPKYLNIDSDEYDVVEGSIKTSLEEYERINNLEICSAFNVLVHFS
ncbi:hypothetical protein, conserved [Plasmodium gonderi]|uniref:Uncharacterized protein n=1 Tax=Plasmodium gonderi TaxID=77519 RepID=A0A1Y1JNI2_PLAGO|nr:hypothetical protein, conserved [Plasmodium gonderi]GAW83098.1 hypothetical protein, conserved [Plasmodium gonderi]